MTSAKCLKPCKGLYADIAVDNSDVRKVEDIEKFDELIGIYEEYKRGYAKDITYPTGLEG